MLSFLAGEDFLNKEWRQGSGGNTNTLWSLSVFSALWLSSIGKGDAPSAVASGCFRYGYERLDSFVPPVPRTPLY